MILRIWPMFLLETDLSGFEDETTEARRNCSWDSFGKMGSFKSEKYMGFIGHYYRNFNGPFGYCKLNQVWNFIQYWSTPIFCLLNMVLNWAGFSLFWALIVFAFWKTLEDNISIDSGSRL
jgi:hypothetical protein